MQRIQGYLFVLLLAGTFSNIVAQNTFKEIAEAAGLVQSTGHSIGVAFGDFNNDFLEDLYIARRLGPNLLYKNLGNDVFVEMGQSAAINYLGNSRTAVWGDLNNDGYLDLYVGNMEESDVLYLNNGDETFHNITATAAIQNTGKVFSVNLADVNRDGWLDIYISNLHQANILYLNDGKEGLPTFTNYTAIAGLTDTKTCMGAIFYDIDQDGDEDLYVTHDARNPNTLYLNDGRGIFEEVAQQAGVDYKGFGMGADIGDIYITNLYENALYTNSGDGTFSEIGQAAGVNDIGMGWGVTLFDFDNDGLQDVYIGNDSYFSPSPNVLYRNKGNNLFEASTMDATIASMQGTYGVAHADIDNDGLQEVAVANISSQDQVQLFKNEHPANNWIGFQLKGVESNRSAIGARVELLDTEGILHTSQITAGNGYAGQHTLRLHIGLGTARAIQELLIYWPNGLVQSLDPVAIGIYYYLEEGGDLQPFDQLSTPVSLVQTEQLDSAVLKGDFEIRLLDAQGQVAYQQAYTSFALQNKELITLSVAGLKGVFFLQVRTQLKEWNRQVLIW